jgi:hypothetical protein
MTASEHFVTAFERSAVRMAVGSPRSAKDVADHARGPDLFIAGPTRVVARSTMDTDSGAVAIVGRYA